MVVNLLKRIKALAISLAILSTLTACGQSKMSKEESAAQYLQAYLEATINNPEETIKSSANLLDKYNIIEDSSNKYTCEVLKYSLRNMSYQIKDIEDVDDTKVKVTINIRAKNIGETLVSSDNLTDCITKATLMVENNTDYETFNSKITEIIVGNIAEDKAKSVNSEVVLNMNYSEGKWHVDINDAFLHAIYGGLSAYENELLNKYDDMPTVEEPEPIETQPSTTEPTEQTTTSEDKKETQSPSESTGAQTEPITTEKTEPTTSTSVSTEEPEKPVEKEEVIYITDEDEFFNYELKPNDTEYKGLSENNRTTRTSRKNPIELGETGTYDNTDYFAPQGKYGLNLTVLEVVKGEAAKEKLREAGENIPISEDEMCILIKVKLDMKVNNTGKEAVQISYLDFDLLNYKDEVQKTYKLKNLPQFSGLTEESPQTTGYLCFKYKKGDNVNLAFKETADNTLWFSIVKK